VKILSVGPGGPDDSTQVISLYMYENAFTYGRFGYASAIGVTLFFITLVLTLVVFRLSRRDRVEY
jgi:N-acetylglucosamine transport system permease protein